MIPQRRRHTLLRLVGGATLTALAAASPPPASAPAVVLQDRQPFYRGSYQAFASPWSTYFETNLVHGVDYRDTIIVRPDRFPDGTLFDSIWPQRAPAKSGVWGYNALSFGNYDGGRPPRPVTPRHVMDIRRLDESFAFRYAGSPHFNLLTEFYLTSKAGDETAKLFEIGFFLHTPQTTATFARAGALIGGYRDRQGRAWTVHRQGTYFMIIPAGGEDVPAGTIEIAPLLSWLMQKRILNGTEWFNGLAFGIEPGPGGGHTRLVVDRWRVIYP